MLEETVGAGTIVPKDKSIEICKTKDAYQVKVGVLPLTLITDSPSSPLSIERISCTNKWIFGLNLSYLKFVKSIKVNNEPITIDSFGNVNIPIPATKKITSLDSTIDFTDSDLSVKGIKVNSTSVVKNNGYLVNFVKKTQTYIGLDATPYSDTFIEWGKDSSGEAWAFLNLEAIKKYNTRTGTGGSTSSASSKTTRVSLLGNSTISLANTGTYNLATPIDSLYPVADYNIVLWQSGLKIDSSTFSFINNSSFTASNINVSVPIEYQLVIKNISHLI